MFYVYERDTGYVRYASEEEPRYDNPNWAHVESSEEVLQEFLAASASVISEIYEDTTKIYYREGSLEVMIGEAVAFSEAVTADSAEDAEADPLNP